MSASGSCDGFPARRLQPLGMRLMVWTLAATMGGSAAWGFVLQRPADELASVSDQVLIGRVTAVDSYFDDLQTLGKSVIFSLVEVEVSHCLKGNCGDTALFDVLGGTVVVDGEPLTMYTSVTPQFEVGDDVLLMLEAGGIGDLMLTDGNYQSSYLILGGDSVVRMSPGPERFHGEDIESFAVLLDDLSSAIGEPFSDPLPDFAGRRQPDYVLLGCDWNYKAHPMNEIYRINANCGDTGCGSDSDIIGAVHRGADVWNNGGADYYFDYGGTTVQQAYSFNSNNIIFWEAANDPNIGAGDIAVTFFWCSGSNMTEWDMVFNDFNFSFWDGVTGSCGGFRYDIQAVAAHEFGHALGLGHSATSSATMWASTGPCNTGPRTLHQDDLNGLNFIYGDGHTTLPFLDNFPSTSIDTSLWIGIDGVIANTSGIGEPSSPYSANIDGNVDGGNSLLSEFLDLSGLANVTVQYWYQRGGGGDVPEHGDDLIIEYPDLNGFWVELTRHVGTGTAMNFYDFVLRDLPAGAYHSDFRLRLRTSSDETGLDDWFVDDLCIGEPGTCPAPPVECDGPEDCDDGIACTVDDCIGTLCVSTPDDANCDDGVGCTVDTCDPNFDCQFAPSNALCADGNICTDDICDPVLDCQYPPSDACSGIEAVVVDATDPGAEALGLSVCNVYVQFDEATDNLLNVGFCNITTNDPAGFYQDPLGADTAPSQVFIDIFPDLVYDSFVDIGYKIVPAGVTDNTSTDPDFDSGLFNCTAGCGGVVGGWFNSNPVNGQGAPDANLQVFVAQFSVNQGFGVTGNCSVFFNDGQVEVPISFECTSTDNCPTDLDNNGTVGPSDLALLLGAWGPNPGHPADIDGDGNVNANDLAILLGTWGPCP